MMADEKGQNTALRRDDHRGSLATILLGSDQVGFSWKYLTALGLTLFGVTFVAYDLGIFSHSGGVVFIPFHAALIGVIAAFWSGYSRNGLVAGWSLTYFSLLGWQAEWATNISPRPFIHRVASIVQLDGLLALAIIGVVVAVIGFTSGAVAEKIITILQTGPQTDSDT